MLNKNDLKAIEGIVDRSIDKKVGKIVDESIDKKVPGMIIYALGEFFEKALAPYLDKKFEKNDNNHDTIFRKLDEIDDHLIDHEKRIKKLETALNP